jgi:hypothetical protein
MGGDNIAGSTDRLLEQEAAWEEFNGSECFRAGSPQSSPLIVDSERLKGINDNP